MVCVHVCVLCVHVCVHTCVCMVCVCMCACVYWHTNVIVISMEIRDRLSGISSFHLTWIPGIIQVFRFVGQTLLLAEISYQPLKTF